MAYSQSNSSVVNSSHGAQALPVFIPTSQPVTPVPLYSTYNTTAETTSGSVTMTIPPHYFYQDVSQEAVSIIYLLLFANRRCKSYINFNIIVYD